MSSGSLTSPIAVLIGGKERATLLATLLAAEPACQLADTDLFTGPDIDDEPATVRQVREMAAKAICRSCPARWPCLAYALATRPSDGIWAGLTADEIRTLDLRDVLAEVA
ncbi:WhiB family transcriptional regulator [Nonomuraea sp. bgisy101]|uniref:WhiB family transcriptional regulator n=1 Tax=Nonomuraea sp. bgisy101 TaxID=3413784 RepID=UPI003D74E1E0